MGKGIGNKKAEEPENNNSTTTETAAPPTEEGVCAMETEISSLKVNPVAGVEKGIQTPDMWAECDSLLQVCFNFVPIQLFENVLFGLIFVQKFTFVHI